MAALSEFERDLPRKRVRSGIAAAQKRGVVFGRRPGQRVKADGFAPKVLELVRSVHYRRGYRLKGRSTMTKGTPPQSLCGIKSQSGIGRDQGRRDPVAVGHSVRYSSESDRSMEEPVAGSSAKR